MSHYQREIDDDRWVISMNVSGQIVANIDEKTKKAISGTGGTWAPVAPIIISGAGLELQCAMQLTNAIAKPLLSTGGLFRFGDSDYFAHAAAVSRTIDDSPLLLCDTITRRRDLTVIGNVTNAVAHSLRTKRRGAIVRMPIRIPDGARLSALEVAFKVGNSHANVPVNLPQVRIIRMQADGTIDQLPSQTTAAGFDENGWVVVAQPASGAAWFAAGALQTTTLTFDAVAGPRADSSVYAYAVEWQEESGTDAFNDYLGETGNYLMHLRITVASPDLRPY